MGANENDEREAKRWWLVRVHLVRARARIARTTGRELGLSGFQEIALLAALQRHLDRDELENALGSLEAIGNLHNCRGGFWRELERAAGYMDLPHREAALNRRFHAALASTVRGE